MNSHGDRPKTAFSTLSCPDWSFQELIENGRRYGYDGVEIRLLQRETDLLSRPEFAPSERAARRRELKDSGFRVCGLASSVRFHDEHKAAREQQLETGRRYLDLAAELGADFIRVFGDVLQATESGSVPIEEVTPDRRQQTVRQVAEGLQTLGEYAEPLGLGVVIETHGDYADTTIVQETMSQVDCSAAGVLWDTHHPWRFFGEPLAESFARLQPRIGHTHWKDSIIRPAPNVSEESGAAADHAHGLMSGHRHADYVLFRGGEFPAVECMRLLRGIAYDGWFSYEWEKMWHPEIEDPEIALPLFPAKIQELWDLVGEY